MTFVAGHFGEWLQGLVGREPQLALVTQACPVAGARARITAADAFELAQFQPVLDPERCSRFLTSLGLATDLRVDLDVDLPPGGGAGMSTAALVAVARAAGADEDAIAPACLAIEGATDPLMLEAPDAVLWAPRAARVLARVPPPPAAEIVGGLWGPPSQTDPRDVAFPVIDDLVAAWAEGPDLAEAARLASMSHMRTTSMRGPKDDPTVDLAQRLGALGVARAHTGPARALVFAPGTAPPGARTELERAGYTHVRNFFTGRHR